MEYKYTYDFDRLHGQDSIHVEPAEYDIGHHGEPISLSDRILAQWPSRIFRVVCNDNICSVQFEQKLNATEQNILTNIIMVHKAVEDWPP